MGIEAPTLEDIYLGDNEKSEEFEQLLNIMNSSYYMSPLLLAYDDHFYNVEKELKTAHLEISRLHENMRQLQVENNKLSDNLELKIREYSKLVARTISNSDILSNFQEEKQELDQRCALLTEENQMLLEQVTLLKQHYDTFNRDYSDKVDDAERKISSYDTLNIKFERVCKDLSDYQKNNKFLESKIREKERTLGMIEEKRKSEVKELNKLRTEHSLMQQEVNYYKDQVDKLNYRIAQDKETIDKQVRMNKDKESHCQDTVMRLESDLDQAKTECRRLNKAIKDRNSEFNDIIKINNELQTQIQELREKEGNVNDESRAYKEKFEKLKFEKEKMKMQEDNYIRQIQKLETDHRTELARREDKYESMLTSKESRARQRYDDLDDKYTQSLSEVDHLKSMSENKDALIRQLELDVASFTTKENKIRDQYERQLKDVQTSYSNLEIELTRVSNDKEKYEITIDKITKDSRNNEKRLEQQIDTLRDELDSAKKHIESLR